MTKIYEIPFLFDVKLSYQPKISLNKKKEDSLCLILHQIYNVPIGMDTKSF